MDEALNELEQDFAQDCLEHLSDIEQNLLDIEGDDAESNQELVNGVFRAAHSIKGGAGMLGFERVKDISHMLENALHMVRSGELSPDNSVVNILLKGFDRLRELIENISESESMSIESEASALLGLMGVNDSGGALESAKSDIPVGKESIFAVDALSLEQAQKSGGYVYLIEFDLIHDIHGRDETPLDLLEALQSAGRIIDCKIDYDAVGTLDDEFGNSIPFYVLYCTILDERVIGGLAKVDPSRVSTIENAKLKGDIDVCDDEPIAYGPFVMTGNGEQGELLFPDSFLPGDIDNLKMAIVGSKLKTLTIDFSNLSEADIFTLQTICALHRYMVSQGGSLMVKGDMPQALRSAAIVNGFTGNMAHTCGFSTCLYNF